MERIKKNFGFNYFDTAHGYLGGKSETALKACGVEYFDVYLMHAQGADKHDLAEERGLLRHRFHWRGCYVKSRLSFRFPEAVKQNAGKRT